MHFTTNYLSSFHSRILSAEAPGGEPATLDIVIPSITAPNREFSVTVAVLDAVGYPSVHCDGEVELELPGGETATIAFHRDSPAVGSIDNVTIAEEGVFRLSARWGELQGYSNPTLCTTEDIPGIYWGDPHVHTNLSNCHPDKCRSLNFCYAAARYMSGLDWVAAADHVSNGRCDRGKWEEQKVVADVYDDSPDFVTLPAYEASLAGGSGGDNNVYMAHFPEMYVDDYENGDIKTLCGKLQEALSEDDFFVVPHHTTRTNKHGEITDEIYPGPEQMPIIEIHSKWGTSEYRGNPNPLKEIHDGPSYAADMLARGMKLGFIAGTDTHATMPSGGGVEPGHIDRLPGLTAVRCDTLDRQSVFTAIKQRQCYAASLERIILHGTMAGQSFGQTVNASELSTPLRFEALVAGKSEIEKIDLVRNGETVHTLEPSSWKARFEYEEKEDLNTLFIDTPYSGKVVYYYLRVTCVSGAQAWSSPVWINNG